MEENIRFESDEAIVSDNFNTCDGSNVGSF